MLRVIYFVQLTRVMDAKLNTVAFEKCLKSKTMELILIRLSIVWADTARLFIMFAAPPELTLEWTESGV